MIVSDDNFSFINKVYTWFLPYFDPCICLFIACQSALESGFGSSNLATYNNNYFGMKTPKVRISTNIGTATFAFYSDFDCSCYDYLLLLSWYHFTPKHLNNLSNFKSKLRSCGYCPDLLYYDRIQSIYDKYYPLFFNNLI